MPTAGGIGMPKQNGHASPMPAAGRDGDNGRQQQQRHTPHNDVTRRSWLAAASQQRECGLLAGSAPAARPRCRRHHLPLERGDARRTLALLSLSMPTRRRSACCCATCATARCAACCHATTRRSSRRYARRGLRPAPVVLASRQYSAPHRPHAHARTSPRHKSHTPNGRPCGPRRRRCCTPQRASASTGCSSRSKQPRTAAATRTRGWQTTRRRMHSTANAWLADGRARGGRAAAKLLCAAAVVRAHWGAGRAVWQLCVIWGKRCERDCKERGHSVA
eukprot:2582140-Prymnesium_polylepis.1